MILVAVNILIILVITIVMMETTKKNVNGMEETVVVVMLTHIFVQLVNVITAFFVDTTIVQFHLVLPLKLIAVLVHN